MDLDPNPKMKNTHLEHLEDVILNKGSSGGFEVVEILRSLGKNLSKKNSDITLTTKWDGAPAVICGIDPQTNKFFVGTKSVFNKKVPKICYSQSDIENFYDGNLANKLSDCLKYLPLIGIEGVIQGDLLFTDDKEFDTVDGEKVVKFTPNTITYTVPINSDLFEKVNNAKLGIVFHTRYEGKTISDMKSVFGFDENTLKKVPEVFVFSSTIKNVIPFNNLELSHYGSAIRRAEGSLKQSSKFLDLIQNEGESKYVMATLFKQFFNSYVRERKILTNVKDVSNNFAQYYLSLLDKEIDSKKNDVVKNKYIKMKKDGLGFIFANQKAIYMTVASYINLQTAKNMVIRQLEKNRSIGTFLKTDNGYKVTAPEGFVAIKSNSAVKLVDRFEFSQNNFNSEKNWDKK